MHEEANDFKPQVLTKTKLLRSKSLFALSSSGSLESSIGFPKFEPPTGANSGSLGSSLTGTVTDVPLLLLLGFVPDLEMNTYYNILNCI